MSNSQPFRPMLPSFGKRNPLQDPNPVVGLNILRDQLPLSSWILLGAVVQAIAVLLIPRFYTLLPAILLSFYQIVDVLLMTTGITRNRYMDKIIRGRFTALIPSKEGVFSNKPSDENVVCFLLTIRANHPLGIFSPGFRDVTSMSQEMFVQLNKNPEQHGFLGSKSLLGADMSESKNHLVILMYFRHLEDVHKFAHGPLHADVWRWWAAKGKKYGYITIAHELYNSPKNNWENVYVDSEPFGITSTVTKVKKISEDGKEVDGEWEYVHPIISAQRGRLAKQYGRLDLNRPNLDVPEFKVGGEY